MKHIATTPSGNTLIECSPKEYTLLTRMDALWKGKLFEQILNHDATGVFMQADMTKPFEAFLTWMQGIEQANDLRYIAGILDGKLGVEERPRE